MDIRQYDNLEGVLPAKFYWPMPGLEHIQYLFIYIYMKPN